MWPFTDPEKTVTAETETRSDKVKQIAAEINAMVREIQRVTADNTTLKEKKNGVGG